MTRGRTVLLDVAIAVTIGVFGVAFLEARSDQTRDHAQAREIARWAREHAASRVAWPESRREAVPALLDAGVTPVLVDDTAVVPAELALNRTPVVVTRTATGPPAVAARETYRTDDFVAHVVDLAAAAATPLAVGESAGEEYARPYVYAPLRDSRRIVRDEPFAADVRLVPGSYRVEVAAFDPDGRTRLRIAVRSGDTLAADHRERLRSVVYEPVTAAFEIAGTAARPVTIRVWALGPEGASALVHAWSVTRLP